MTYPNILIQNFIKYPSIPILYIYIYCTLYSTVQQRGKKDSLQLCTLYCTVHLLCSPLYPFCFAYLISLLLSFLLSLFYTVLLLISILCRCTQFPLIPILYCSPLNLHFTKLLFFSVCFSSLFHYSTQFPFILLYFIFPLSLLYLVPILHRVLLCSPFLHLNYNLFPFTSILLSSSLSKYTLLPYISILPTVFPL